MLADTDLSMSGYSGDQRPAMQKRMIEALQTIPGVKSVGFISQVPLSGGSSAKMSLPARRDGPDPIQSRCQQRRGVQHFS